MDGTHDPRRERSAGVRPPAPPAPRDRRVGPGGHAPPAHPQRHVGLRDGGSPVRRGLSGAGWMLAAYVVVSAVSTLVLVALSGSLAPDVDPTAADIALLVVVPVLLSSFAGAWWAGRRSRAAEPSAVVAAAFGAAIPPVAWGLVVLLRSEDLGATAAAYVLFGLAGAGLGAVLRRAR